MSVTSRTVVLSTSPNSHVAWVERNCLTDIQDKAPPIPTDSAVHIRDDESMTRGIVPDHVETFAVKEKCGRDTPGALELHEYKTFQDAKRAHISETTCKESHRENTRMRTRKYRMNANVYTRERNREHERSNESRQQRSNPIRVGYKKEVIHDSKLFARAKSISLLNDVQIWDFFQVQHQFNRERFH